MSNQPRVNLNGVPQRDRNLKERKWEIFKGNHPYRNFIYTLNS